MAIIGGIPHFQTYPNGEARDLGEPQTQKKAPTLTNGSSDAFNFEGLPCSIHGFK